MNSQDRKEVETIAKLTVREFFDHYLDEVFPEQLDRVIHAHNTDVAAHTEQIQIAVRTESYRLRLWLIGLIFTIGIGGGVGIAKAVAAIAGK